MVIPRAVNPAALGRPIGFAHGMRAGGLLFVAGQVGGEGSPEGTIRIVSPDMAAQFEKAIENVLAVVREAGGRPEDVVEMTVFVTDLGAYKAARRAIGEAWKRHLGRHYPAMTLVQVAGLVDEGAKVEIRAVAALEGR